MYANTQTPTAQLAEQTATRPRSESFSYTYSGTPWATSTTRVTALVRYTADGPVLQHVRTRVLSQRADSETTIDADPWLEDLPVDLRRELPDGVTTRGDPCA